jgi:methylenetetrahydrofolate dehydrogenase (NADP+)/methenyltetrahydrofolate cyclohydrolase
LEQNEAKASVIRSKTENPAEISRQADIIVSGVGKPGLINGNMVKDGVVVIDYGYGKNLENKMSGDVDFDSVVSKASLITPVPGGMGPILITAVLKNLVRLNS